MDFLTNTYNYLFDVSSMQTDDMQIEQSEPLRCLIPPGAPRILKQNCSVGNRCCFKKHLGKGAFASVDAVEVNGKTIALKSVLDEHLGDTFIMQQEKAGLNRAGCSDYTICSDTSTFDNDYQIGLEFLPDGDLLQFSDTLQRLGEEEQFAAELPYFYHKKKYFNNALFEKRKKTLSVERFRNLVFHLTNGLVYLHEFKQMAHSDIKPQNILIDKNKFKFADMGLACDITNPQLCGGGTRKYQFKQGIFNNLRVSQENDVYALLKTFSMVAPSVRTHKYITDLMGDLKRNSRKGFTITARQLLTEFQRAI